MADSRLAACETLREPQLPLGQQDNIYMITHTHAEGAFILEPIVS